MTTPEQLAAEWGLAPGTIQKPKAQRGPTTPEQLAQEWGLSPHGMRVEGAADAAEAAVPQLQRQHEIDFFRQLGALPPEQRARTVAAAEPHLKTLGQARASIPKLIGEAGREGQTEEVQRLAATTAQVNKPDPSLAEQAVSMVGKGAHMLGTVLDAPGRYLIRPAITPGGGWWDDPIPAEEWTKRLHEAADQGHVGAKVYTAATGAAGAVVGAPIAAGALAAANALGAPIAEPLTNLMEHQTGKSRFDLYLDAIKGGARAGGDVLATALPDPLTYLSLGESAIGKNAVSSITRVVTKVGLAQGLEKSVVKGVAREIAEQAGTILSREGASKEGLTAVKNILKRVLPEATIEEQFGRNMELLGRGQLRAGIPFTEKGVDILPTITGQENVAGRALQGTVGRGIEALGGTAPLSRTREQAKVFERQARGIQTMLDQHAEKGLEEIAFAERDLIGKQTVSVPLLGPDDPVTGVPGALERAPYTLKELVERHIKPEFDVIEGGDQPLVQAAQNYLPRSALSAEEKSVVDKLTSFLDEYGGELEQAGVIGARAKDPVSGLYFPGAYEGKYGFLSEITDPLSGYSLSRQRTGPARIGAAADARQSQFRRLETDPYKVLPQYTRQANRKLSKKWLEGKLADEFGETVSVEQLRSGRWKPVEGGKAIPAEVHNVLRGSFNTQLETFSQALRLIPGIESHAVGRNLLKALDFATSAGSAMKARLLLNRPGFHTVNMLNDTSQMVVRGVNNPIGEITRAISVAQAAEKGADLSITLAGRTFDAADIVMMAKQNNVPIAGTAADYAGSGTGGLTQRLTRIATGKKPDRLYDKALRAGETFARGWEGHSRLGLFIWGLDKGMSPTEAAKMVADTLLDYGDRGTALQIARWFMPFATWMWKAPAMTGRLLATQPGRMAFYQRALDGFAGERVEPRQHVKERGKNIPLGPIGGALAGSVIEGMGGRPGAREILIPRDFASEALQPVAELLPEVLGGGGGNIDPLLLQLGPLTQLAATNAFKKDPVTKTEYEERISPAGVFPPATPIAHELGLTASAGQLPWGPKLAPYLPYLGSPLGAWMANVGINKLAGGPEAGAPVAVLGTPREYGYARDPSDIYARGLLSILTGIPIYAWDPSHPLANRAQSAEVKRLQASTKSTKESRKEIERRRR